jgi:hypothetical protein
MLCFLTMLLERFGAKRQEQKHAPVECSPTGILFTKGEAGLRAEPHDPGAGCAVF